MKVTFKWDGKDAYTPRFFTMNNDNPNELYFGILARQEKDTEDGVLWIADDLIYNFESAEISNDAIVIKTTHNAFIFRSDQVKNLPKGEIFTGVVYLDDNDECIPRNYCKFSFINE